MSSAAITEFSAILFDMDGLLLDTESIALKLLKETVEKFGFDWSDDIGIQMIGRNADDGDTLLASHYGAGFSVVEIRVAFLKTYRDYLIDNGVPLKSGATELLKELKSSKVPCALVTSSRKKLTDLKLQGAGIAGYFQTVICGDEVKYGKPNPECYLLAAHKLATESGKCLVLEDSAPGIEAGLAADMTAWCVPDKTPLPVEFQARGVVVLGSLNEVRQRLFG